MSRLRRRRGGRGCPPTGGGPGEGQSINFFCISMLKWCILGDENFTFSDQISSLSLSPAILIFVSSAVSVLTLILRQPTITASIVYSKIVYCNSVYYNIPKSQINRHQQIQTCLARTVVKAPKSSHITRVLRSLHWLKINERIEYKLLSLTYKVLTTSQSDYLRICSVYR